MNGIIIIAVLVFAATLLGGFFALRFKDKLHLILGFSAGAVLGIALLDLFPESLELTGNPQLSVYLVLCAVLVYMIIDRLFFKHGHHHGDHHDDGESAHEHAGRGIIRASSLIFHSFLDGLAIGFSFQVSTAVGTLVAVAVLAHDFSDGINTVAAILKSGGQRAKAWLFADAIAPVVGIIVGSLFVVPEKTLGIILSIFTGFFIYISLADMIPESFHSHPKKWTTILTIIGAGFIALVIQFAAY